MDPLARPNDAAALLAESGWVRALARRLVGDDELAEEIVQDTCVAALERRPSSEHGLRAWLAVVTRNLALRARRRAAVRRSVERVAARAEATSGGQEEVERMQLQRWLAGAILALDEPARSAVILRHLDGCSARQIARRQGCTEAAARQRIARGLCELRERLDRRYGRRAWAALLARAGSLDAGAGPTLLTLGGIGMGTKAILGLAAGLAACALAAATLLPERARSERSRVTARTEAEPEVARAATSTPVEEPAPVAPARDAAPSRRALPGGSARAEPAALAGVVSDSAGRAVAGASARLARAAEDDAEDALASATTVALGPGELADAGQPTSVTTELDPKGRFELHDLPVGRLIRLSARAKGFAAGSIETSLALEPDGIERIDVELTRGATVTGIVIDALTRAPVPGAAVWAESYDFDPQSVNPTTHADAGGRFTLEGVAVDLMRVAEGGQFAHVYLLAEAEGYAAARTRGFGATWNEAAVYEFEVTLDPAASSLAGRVLLPGGREPAPGALFRSVDALGNLHITQVDEDGRFVLDALPQGSLAFTVRSTDHWDGVGEASLDAAIELAPGERRNVDLELEAPGTLVELRLLDESGQALPGRELECTSFFLANNLRMTLDGATFTSDPSGRVRIEGLAPGEYEFQPLPQELCGDPPLQRLALERGQHVSLPDFRVGTCRSLAGWIDCGSVPCSELELAVRRAGATDWIESIAPASDGSFVVERLLAGPHELVLRRGELELDRAFVDPRDEGRVTLSARAR